MPLGMEVGLGPGDFVSDGDPAQKKSTPTPPIFGPCLLWPNVWMGEDSPLTTEVVLGPGLIILSGVPAFHGRGTAALLFSANVYCGHDCPFQLLLSSSCCMFVLYSETLFSFLTLLLG